MLDTRRRLVDSGRRWRKVYNRPRPESARDRYSCLNSKETLHSHRRPYESGFLFEGVADRPRVVHG